MSEAVETFLLYPSSFQNPVVPLAEVHRPGVAALLVAHEGRCGAEIALLAQLPYRLLCAPFRGTRRLLVAVLVLPTFTSLPGT